jgi:hypothetical protein
MSANANASRIRFRTTWLLERMCDGQLVGVTAVEGETGRPTCASALVVMTDGDAALQLVIDRIARVNRRRSLEPIVVRRVRFG